MRIRAIFNIIGHVNMGKKKIYTTILMQVIQIECIKHKNNDNMILLHIIQLWTNNSYTI